MGQTLSSPATEKKSESGEDDHLFFAVSEMQGWRITMEDAHAAVLTLEDGTKEKNSFFAVYDGHGGSTVAKFAGNNVHKRLLAEEAYREKRYEEAMKKAFLGTDEDLLADPAHTRDPSGCTAVAALLTHDKKIYVANAGDSRSVISVKGEHKPLSFDHKPTNDSERARIIGAGGYIEYGRVNGNLALSRALGDFEFKKNYSLIPQKQVITSDPDVTVHEITNEDEFLVLACDGIWDCLTSQQVVDFIRLKVSEGKALSEISEEICGYCLAPDTSSGTGIGCDNMTLLIVAILNGKTKQQWYDWVTDRVKTGYGFRTPDTIPPIYSSARIMAYKARREAQEERERLRSQRGEDFNTPQALFGSGAFSGFARVLGSTGGISFSPNTGIVTDSGARLMFTTAHDEEDSGDDLETDSGLRLFADSFTLERPVDPAASLRDHLAAYEQEMRDGHDDGLGGSIDSHVRLRVIDDEDIDGPFNQINGDAAKPPTDSTSHTEQQLLSSEAPSVPQPRLNGDVAPVQQLHSQPLGDQPDPVVKAEGLMDTSEDPLVA